MLLHGENIEKLLGEKPINCVEGHCESVNLIAFSKCNSIMIIERTMVHLPFRWAKTMNFTSWNTQWNDKLIIENDNRKTVSQIGLANAINNSDAVKMKQRMRLTIWFYVFFDLSVRFHCSVSIQKTCAMCMGPYISLLYGSDFPFVHRFGERIRCVLRCSICEVVAIFSNMGTSPKLKTLPTSTGKTGRK